MYINDINILYYVIFGIAGVLVGQIIDWCNERLPKHKDIISKEFFTEYLKNTQPKYLLMIIVAIIYMGLLYIYGPKDITLYKYILLTPMLISVFIIDYKEQIIPNRLTFTIFEVGMLGTIIQAAVNVNVGITIAMEMILGMLVGIGIFLVITIIGSIFMGKEAMGFGDVKLMGALGLYFGWMGIIEVSLMSFLIGAIVSVFLLIFKRKDKSEYIAFGPFIVMASFILMAFQYEQIMILLYRIFTLGAV